ncbi:hypothetical protein [Streptomyces sp. NPDC001914]|uniref:hypothetical protein n=1 Tax=Streptomyces sp. NPDC001914 TaxID=3364623 RepID=UPI0036743684
MPTSYDLLQDLVDAREERCQVRAELRTLCQRVPWSAEPPDAWETHEKAWRVPASSPAAIPRTRRRSPGSGREGRTTTAIVTHTYRSSLAPADVLARA